MIFFGLNEIQIAELILLVLSTGIITGTFIGLIMRAMKKLI